MSKETHPPFRHAVQRVCFSFFCQAAERKALAWHHSDTQAGRVSGGQEQTAISSIYEPLQGTLFPTLSSLCAASVSMDLVP